MNKLITISEDDLRLLNGSRDPVRMEIILLLAPVEAMSVGEIASQFRVSRPAISHHLKVLKDSGIVQSERVGQEIYYHLNRALIIAGMRRIADAIENCCPSDQTD